MSRTAALERDAAALQDALTALIRVYQFRDRDAICGYDVSSAQSHALERLAAQGPLTLNALAAALFLEKSSASRLVDGLERKGLVVKRPNKDDARSVLLQLSKPGRGLWDKIRRDLIDERAAILTDLGPAERAVVIQSIARLAEAAAHRVDAQRGACARA